MQLESIRFLHDPDVTGVPYSPQSDDEEVVFRLTDGRRFYCWFWTLTGVSNVMARHYSSGENLGGAFFWTTSMVIIDEISKERIEAVIREFVERDGDLSPFELQEDIAE